MQPIKKLHWKCRRGMKELDILFEHYLYTYYENAEHNEQIAFETLIDMQDPIITDYLFGRKQIENTMIVKIIDIMREYSQSS